MTMQNVRIKALKNNKFAILATDKRLKRLNKQKDRVATAINASWSVKSISDADRELVIERATLRAEITAITIKELGRKNSTASVLIATKLKRIDKITSALNERKTHV